MKLRTDSILFRIAWLHIAALAVAAVAVPLASYLLLSSTANSFENQTLRRHAGTIVRYLKRSNTGWKLSLPDDLSVFYARNFDGFAFSVVDDKGRLIASSRPSTVPIFEGQKNSAEPQYFQEHQGKSTYYGASIPERIGGTTVWIEMAQDLEHPDVILDDVVANFLRQVMWFTIPIMLLVLAIDVAVVRRALRPVSAASDRAREIDPARLDARIPEKSLPVEIRPLVTAFNEALDRLERAFQVQREFTADAAHELRTPLAVLRARVELLPDGSPATKQIQHDVDVMAHIVDQLLAVAELENRTVDFSEVLDIRSVLSQVVEHLAPIAEGQGKKIGLSVPPGPVVVRGDAALLFQAFRNLAENAVRHTREGTVVELTIDGNGIVRVLDCGPGIPAENREVIFRRFWRRDRSNSSGAGLGLSIAARIIGAHDGTIVVDDRMPEGAAFSVRLHVATSPL